VCINENFGAAVFSGGGGWAWKRGLDVQAMLFVSFVRFSPFLDSRMMKVSSFSIEALQ
jgi:hypothetical protein